MTISTTTSRTLYAGNGVTTIFSFPYLFLANGDLEVRLIAASGASTVLTLTTDYTVTGANNDAGGSVTMIVAPASGEQLLIRRIVDLTQETAYPSGDSFPAESHERALDKLTMIVQQHDEELARTIQLPPTVAGVSTELPAPELNSVLGWDSSGESLRNYPLASLATVLAFATYRYSTFTGDGVEDTFPLSVDPATLGNIDVSLNGLTAVPGTDYTLVSGGLVFTVPPALGVQILARYGESLPSGSAADATDVSYTPAGTGAVTTTAQAKLRESVSVKDFGAVGDGVTDDTAEIQAAVTAALAADAQLIWPAGDYLTTASITNFHAVRHVGAGVVVRGSDSFYPQPKAGARNILYVAATGGDNANDGLSASQPFATIKAAGDTIYKYPYSDGFWRVQLAAGTYTQATSFLFPFPTSQRVEFYGPSVSIGTVPTAIIASPGGVATGLFFQNYSFVFVRDIKVSGFSPVNASGITGDANSNLWLINCHAEGCDAGFEISQSSFLRVTGGIIQNNTVGVRAIARAGFTIGSGGTVASILGDTGPALLNNTQNAVFAQEGCSGHVDYCYMDGNGLTLDVIDRSRIHMMGSYINGTSSTTGVRIRVQSSFYDNPVVTNTWGTFQQRIVYGAFSVEDVDTKYVSARPELLVTRSTGTVSTSSTSLVTAATQAFEPYELTYRGSGFVLDMLCSVTGTAGTKRVVVTFAGSTLLDTTIEAAVAAYTVRVEFITRDGIAANSQKVCCTVLKNGQTPVVTLNAALTIDLKVAQTLTIQHLVADAADTNRIQNLDVTVIR